MKADSEQLISRFLRCNDRAICVDFDGTLSEIVENPEQADPVDGTAEILCELARTFERVCVLSGRPVSFLLNKLEFPRQNVDHPVLYGLYGVEVWESNHLRSLADSATKCTIATARRMIEGLLHDNSLNELLLVEDKILSVALHYRSAPLLEDRVIEIVNSVAQSLDLEVRAGKMVVELVPKGCTDKASTLGHFCSGASGVCVIGDDVGDIGAFRELDTLADLEVAIRVAVSGPQAPVELLDLADVVLASPIQVKEFLSKLLRMSN